jgi:hypothetical protein
MLLLLFLVRVIHPLSYGWSVRVGRKGERIRSKPTDSEAGCVLEKGRGLWNTYDSHTIICLPTTKDTQASSSACRLSPCLQRGRKKKRRKCRQKSHGGRTTGMRRAAGRMRRRRRTTTVSERRKRRRKKIGRRRAKEEG